MASDVGIANAALRKLGQSPITSFSENSKAARLANERYAELRDELLSRHPWNFALKRASLAADAVDPTWGFDFAYTLPSDWLKLIEIDNPARYPYHIEGRKVITDITAPLKILYIFQVTNVIEMDVMFRQALAAELAADVAEAITGSSEKVDRLRAISAGKIRASRVPDGQEHSPERVEASEWLDAREEQGFSRRVPTGTGTPL